MIRPGGRGNKTHYRVKQAGRGARPRTIEVLEQRALLAADSLAAWQNPRNQFDVNNDGLVGALDALIIINQLNASGSRPLSSSPASTTASTAVLRANSSSTTSANPNPGDYVDVNADNFVSGLDALMVINALTSPLASIQLATTDLAGNLISTVAAGTDFKLEARVKDLRTNPPQPGVFSAYTDVTYDNLAAASILAGTVVTHISPYLNTPAGDVSTAGLINEAGAFSNQQQAFPDTSEVPLWTVVVHASAAGVVHFTADPADGVGHDVLLYGQNTKVPTDQVTYGTTSITVSGQTALQISDVTQLEGNTGQTPFVFNLSLSQPAPSQFTVNYSTTNGTATTADSDYVAASGVVTFAANVSTQQITVFVNGDTTREPNETFNVNLSSAGPISITKQTGVGTIQNDDPLPQISIQDPSLPELNSGLTPFAFTVTLSNASSTAITVDYATADGTAAAPSQYIAQNGHLTFAPGTTSRTITISVVGDTVQESNENFFVNLSNPANATIAVTQAVGTILDDDGPPTLSINDVTVTEGDTSTSNMVFTVSMFPSSLSTVTVNFTTVDGSAHSSADYFAEAGIVTFLAGTTSQTITIPIIGDTIPEPTETFLVSLSNPTGGAVLPAGTHGTGTILDNDAVGSITIDDVSVLEGNVGTTNAVFTVSLLAAPNHQVTVGFATVDNTATAGLDYSAVSGVLTFDHSTTSQTVTVAVLGDTINEADETFLLALSNPVGATLDRTAGVGTILNDDAPPSFSISGPAPVPEGNSATTPAVFTVTLSAASGQPLTVDYATTDGTAMAPADYTSQSGTLVFDAGVTTQKITVAVIGDTINELDENFSVVLSNPSGGASITQASSSATILNDDPLPVLSISDVAMAEGNSGTTPFVFTVTLSGLIDRNVSVDYATADGTATAPGQYAAASGQLIFAPGITSQTITVSVVGDTVNEPNQTFLVNLSNPSNATFSDAQGTGTILNDDSAGPTLFINGGTTVTEGDINTSPAVLTVTLLPTSNQTVTVDYSTADGTALAGSDYIAKSGTITFNPGTDTQTITIAIVGDTLPESTETFLINLSNPVGAALPANTQGTITILDNDSAGAISINDVSVAEGNSGITNAVFTVSLASPLNHVVTVGYATQDNTALAGSDYTAQTGVLTFAPNVTTLTLTVPVIGDTLVESDESFFVNLSSPVGATIARSQATGIIVNDDGLSIDDVVVVEGNSGTTNAVFTVRLSSPAAQPVTVGYTTSDGTATAPSDYVAQSGQLSFAPGETSKTLTIAVNGDTTPESNETFFVILDPNTVTGTGIAHGQGIGTILDDDNAAPKLAQIRLQLVNPVTLAPITNPLNVGDTFLLQAEVSDLRANPQGIAAAFLDVSYDPNVVTPNGSIVFGPHYVNAQSGDATTTPGLINEVGGLDGTTPLGGGEQLLFSLQFQAKAFGNARFTPDPADLSAHAVLEFGTQTPIPANQVIYTETSLPVGSNFFTIDNVSHLEGNSGTTNFVFTVTRFLPANTAGSVNYSVTSDTATAGVDFQAQSGTLNFPVGVTSRTLTVAVIGDTTDEFDETFFVNLSNPIGSVLGNAKGVGTILNDDQPPTLMIASASGSEGQTINFPVTLSAPSGKTVTVQFTTLDSPSGNLATAGSDYLTTTGTLTFAPGVTQQLIPVTTLGDLINEPTETFQVMLSNPVNAAIATGTAVGSILNVPPASLSGFVYLDANGDGIKQPGEIGIQNVPVTLTRPGSSFSQTALTAADGSYSFTQLIAGSYTLTETQPAFYFDGIDRAGSPAPTGPITNDAFVGIQLGPSVSATGFNFGEAALRAEFLGAYMNRRLFPSPAVALGQFGAPGSITGLDLRQGDVWVSFDGGWNGRRIMDAFYFSNQGTATMTLYDNSMHAVATSTALTNDAQIQFDATAGNIYFLKISGSNPSVTVQITDTVTISDVTVNEGNVGTTNAVFTVTLSAPPALTATVNYATADGTATSGTDYVAASGVLTFAPGVTTQTVTVVVNGDVVNEANETFLLNLSSPFNLAIFRTQATGTIIDDDPLPKLSIADVSKAEGNTGTSAAVFTVTLSSVSGQTVKIGYSTADGTAVAASGDYVPATGSLTFAPGVTTQLISVTINGDTAVEPNETFFVNLSGPVNATVLDSQAIGTITNDDGAIISAASITAGSSPSPSASAGANAPSSAPPAASSSSAPPSTASSTFLASAAVSSPAQPIASGGSASGSAAVDRALAENDDWLVAPLAA